MSGIFNSLKNLTSGAKYSGQDTRLRFSVAPLPGDSGFTQWHDAMKMVARLPGGIPSEFRRRLWLTLAEKHLQARGIDWPPTERAIFNEWSNPDDEELGIQIVKDLHRTGCSLFCGAAGERNQALLKRVLLAYARWNKAVGYCQGFNMLAALILQVMERSEGDSVKVMIYLIEGVLPESYFANNLRGLSVDMAVFRELLRIHLPSLSKHLETLQSEAGDIASGTSYEPPLTNVFTMQWFLTLFANCLPQTTVLRVWDLVFLEGNEVLLRAALAIWATLEDRIMAVESADEFYSIMGVLTREMLEFGLMDPNNLVKVMVTIAPFPFPELPELRDRYTYNITPWSHSVSNAARRGLRLFQSDDDEADDEEAADDEKMAVAAAFGISGVFRSSPRRRGSVTLSPALGGAGPGAGPGGGGQDKERINLDISALKKQYSKLRERQRQAHIILTAACARPPGPTRQVATPSAAPVVMNHLLLGRSALLGVRRGAGPVPATTALHQPQRGGGVRTSRQPQTSPRPPAPESGETLHWRDAKRRPSESIVVTAKSPSPEQVLSPPRERSSSSSSTSSASSHRSSSSGSTELCDEPDRMSDFESEDARSPGLARKRPDAVNINSDTSLSLPINSDNSLPLPVVHAEDENGSPLKSPLSDPSSSPTEEASSQDQISQLSLSPLLNSPSITIQNSPSSTIQNSSPINPDSPLGFCSSSKNLEHSFSDEKMHSLSQEFSSIENIGVSSQNYNMSSEMPSLLDSPTKSVTPTILVSPIPNVLMSPVSEIEPVTTPVPLVDMSPLSELEPITHVEMSPIPNFIDLNLTPSPKIEKKTCLFTKTGSIDQATSPIDWNRLDSGVGGHRPQENSPDLITSHWLESDTSGHAPLVQLDDTSESVFSPESTTPNVQGSGVSTPLRMVPLGSLSASLSSPSSADEDVTLPDLMVITPPKELSPLSPLKSPKWNNETVQWDASKFPFPSKSPINWDSSKHSPIVSLEKSPINWDSSKQSPIVSLEKSPINWDSNTQVSDMPIEKPANLDTSKENDSFEKSPIHWDSSKHSSDMSLEKSPINWDSSKPISDISLEKSPKSDEFEWELPKPEISSPEDNLINWDLSTAVLPTVESTDKLDWKSEYTWSESAAGGEQSWGLGDGGWKPGGAEGKWEPKLEPEIWHSSTDLRESASDAPASPLPSSLKTNPESWHSIPPQFPTLNETKPEISELPTVTENVVLETKPELPTVTENVVLETKPELLPESRELRKYEGVETRNSTRSDRKRWTIAEPIAWSVICDAISQQQENQQQRPVSPLVEEEEEGVREVSPVERGAFGRRNSERALQIIQENSEILQRIMRESRGKQLMERETRAARPTSIGLGGGRGVRWGSQRELTSEAPPPTSTPPLVESPAHTATWKPSTCFPNLGESPQNVSPAAAPFNPFPVRPKPQTRELGVRLGLYPTRQLSK